MKVSELIRILQSVDPDREVVIVQPLEGNFTARPLDRCKIGTYRADTTYHGVYGIQKLTPKLARQGYGYGDVVKGVNALILKPVS